MHTIPLYHTSPELWKPLAHANFKMIVRWAIGDVCDFKYVNFKHPFGFEIFTWTDPDPDPQRHMASLGHNDLKRFYMQINYDMIDLCIIIEIAVVGLIPALSRIKEHHSYIRISQTCSWSKHKTNIYNHTQQLSKCFVVFVADICIF